MKTHTNHCPLAKEEGLDDETHALLQPLSWNYFCHAIQISKQSSPKQLIFISFGYSAKYVYRMSVNMFSTDISVAFTYGTIKAVSTLECVARRSRHRKRCCCFGVEIATVELHVVFPGLFMLSFRVGYFSEETVVIFFNRSFFRN